MIGNIRRIGLYGAAALMTVGMAAGVLAATRNQNTSEPQGSFSGRRGGPPMGMMGAGGPMGPMGMLGPLVAHLGLTDTQKDQVKGIMQAHRDEFRALGDQAATAHKALEQAILLDPVSDAAVQSASAGVAAVESEMAVAAAHVRAEVFQILTDAQKAQVKQLIAQRDAGRRRGRN